MLLPPSPPPPPPLLRKQSPHTSTFLNLPDQANSTFKSPACIELQPPDIRSSCICIRFALALHSHDHLRLIRSHCCEGGGQSSFITITIASQYHSTTLPTIHQYSVPFTSTVHQYHSPSSHPHHKVIAESAPTTFHLAAQSLPTSSNLDVWLISLPSFILPPFCFPRSHDSRSGFGSLHNRRYDLR